jgi:hypothetical protein
VNGWTAVDAFLQADPRDVGCEQALEVLHIYLELGPEAQQRYPGVAAHLRACGACTEDFHGLLEAMRLTASPQPSEEI